MNGGAAGIECPLACLLKGCGCVRGGAGEGQVVVEAVTRLAWEALACPTPTFRVVIQASRALGQIAKERHLLTALLDPSCLMHGLNLNPKS